ncbi:C-terminal binding protein [Natrialba sp. INN-245]|uniref:C-terminal binding protein n=1 Tax=Natrialba sp. INN-245 TaxID=2690967 RepID=UPI0013128895|nr:C-terminal binding protein [Natrialba sp. INN-245]MWV38853.1 C-terminal binding protein [Natrialba sp. INN-245]
MANEIAVTDHNFPDLSIERNTLEDAGYSVRDIQAETEEEIIRHCKNSVALLNQYQTISERVFTELEQLEVIGRYGIGVDTIDLSTATEYGVAVVNVPEYCINEVAEHTIALLLSIYRQIPNYDRQFRDGEWDWKAGQPLHRFSESTIGLVGFGQIPRKVAESLDGFNLRIVASDPNVDKDTMADYGVKKVNFESLVDTAEVISIHTPLIESTQNLFDEEVFKQMRNDAILINTSRGGVVNTDDLIGALQDDHIRGAAIDVLADEPPKKDNVLRSIDDVIVTPHTAWYSEESIQELRRTVAENVLQVLRGEEITDIINEVALP